jgi:peroxiredoxin (alkyl hydroperoxide reductase subunit C)
VADAYGVFNREFGRPDRATFLIDKQGIVRWIKLFKPGELPDTVQVLDALREIETS